MKLYSIEHFWADIVADTATVGVTAYVIKMLGGVKFISPPNPGDTVAAGHSAGAFETKKLAMEIISPVSGEVIEIQNLPELTTAEPEGNGWLFKVRLTAEPSALMTGEEYAEQVR